MKIAITGGSGFLGARVAKALLSAATVRVGGHDRPLELLRLIDRAAPHPELAADDRVEVVSGDLPDVVQAGGLDGVDAVVHLAAVVSSAAEADFDLGMRVNVDAARDVLDRLRRLGGTPLLVFASSVAVFGHEPGEQLAGPVTDDTVPRPQSSYGVEKLIGEHLVAEYSRRRWVRGRTLRLMTVAVRPGPPNSAASGFLSAIVREPLAGLPTTCPVPPATAVALCSPGRAVAALLRALGASDEEWPWTSAVTMPALTTTPAEMTAAMDRLVPGSPSRLVEWEEDAGVAAIVTSWPARFATERARSLGLVPDPDVASLLRAYLDEL